MVLKIKAKKFQHNGSSKKTLQFKNIERKASLNEMLNEMFSFNSDDIIWRYGRVNIKVDYSCMHGIDLLNPCLYIMKIEVKNHQWFVESCEMIARFEIPHCIL